MDDRGYALLVCPVLLYHGSREKSTGFCGGVQPLVDVVGPLDFLHVGGGLRVGDGVQGLPILGVGAVLEPAVHVAHARVVSGQGHLQMAVVVQQQPEQGAPAVKMSPPPFSGGCSSAIQSKVGWVSCMSPWASAWD